MKLTYPKTRQRTSGRRPQKVEPPSACSRAEITTMPCTLAQPELHGTFKDQARRSWPRSQPRNSKDRRTGVPCRRSLRLLVWEDEHRKLIGKPDSRQRAVITFQHTNRSRLRTTVRKCLPHKAKNEWFETRLSDIAHGLFRLKPNALTLTALAPGQSDLYRARFSIGGYLRPTMVLESDTDDAGSFL